MLASVMSACTKENLDDISVYDEVTLSGSYGANMETKTTLGDTELDLIPVLWSQGDAIGIFTTSAGTVANNAKGSLTNGVGQRNGTFTSLSVKMADADNVFYLYYPYDKDAGKQTDITNDNPVRYTDNGGNPFIEGVLSPSQTQKEANDFSHFGKYGYSVAKSEPVAKGETINFTMEHLLSYLELSFYSSDVELSGYSVEEITVSTPVGSKVAGPFKGYFEGQPDNRYAPSSVVEPTAYSNAISLSVEEPKALTTTPDAAQKFILSMLPVDLTSENMKVVVKVSKQLGEFTQIRFYALTFEGTEFKEDHLLRIGSDLGSWERIYPLRAAVIWEEGMTVSNVDLVTSASGTDLTSQLSNAFLVEDGGSYFFPAKEADGSWIQGIEPGEFDHVTFTLPAGARGNALIGVYRWDPDDQTNNSNTILYSWHIWATETNDVTVDGTTFMDRNLGTTSITPGDVSSLNYYYQWGRKDPFPKAAAKSLPTVVRTVDLNDPTRTVIPTINISTFANITWTIARYKMSYEDTYNNPTSFIEGVILGTDYYNDKTQGYLNMPSFDPSRTTTWASFADPCPKGYRVATLDELAKLTASAVHDNVNLGFTMGGMWFPQTGYRDNQYCNLSTVGTQSLVWANASKPALDATNPTGKYAHSMLNNVAAAWVNGNIAGGRSVRCVKN